MKILVLSHLWNQTRVSHKVYQSDEKEKITFVIEKMRLKNVSYPCSLSDLFNTFLKLNLFFFFHRFS